VWLASGDEARALVELERELTREASGHLYARECCANTWYAIGAIHLRHGRLDAARAAFEEALARLPAHTPARLGIAAADAGGHLPSIAAATAARDDAATSASVDEAMCRAAACVLARDPATAGRLVDAALARAAAGSAGWLLPIEPILDVPRSADAWHPALARLRARAS